MFENSGFGSFSVSSEWKFGDLHDLIMSKIPSVEQVMDMTGWDASAWHRIFVCLGLAIIVLLLPVAFGLFMSLLEQIQKKLLSVISTNLAFVFVNFVTFPGTIFHELSHLLMAVLTGAKVVEVKLLEVSGNTLGHVSYINRRPAILHHIQNALTSCAPAVFGFFASVCLLDYILVGGHAWWVNVLLWYLFLSLVNHATMSPPDLKIYFSGVWIFILPIFACFMWL